MTAATIGQVQDLAISVRGLTKRYGERVVVDHFSMDVERGRIYGFLGPNGSGKTTTIRMICGLLTPDEGEGTCLGFNLRTEAAKIKSQVGYMTQKFGLYDDLSIEENLDFIARVYQVPERKKRLAQTIERLELGTRKNQLAGRLSGGWKQRLALAACLIHDPKLLLLDEPTAGVDPQARRDFWEQIHALAAQGITVLVSTHYMDEAERCHQLAYISYGRLLTQGTVAQVIAGAGLATWSINGDSLNAVAQQLRSSQGITTVAAFGTTLHVTATNEESLNRALAPLADRSLKVESIEPQLEDVFIALMAKANDNFAAKPS